MVRSTVDKGFSRNSESHESISLSSTKSINKSQDIFGKLSSEGKDRQFQVLDHKRLNNKLLNLPDISVLEREILAASLETCCSELSNINLKFSEDGVRTTYGTAYKFNKIADRLELTNAILLSLNNLNKAIEEDNLCFKKEEDGKTVISGSAEFTKLLEETKEAGEEIKVIDAEGESTMGDFEAKTLSDAEMQQFKAALLTYVVALELLRREPKKKTELDKTDLGELLPRILQLNVRQLSTTKVSKVPFKAHSNHYVTPRRTIAKMIQLMQRMDEFYRGIKERKLKADAIANLIRRIRHLTKDEIESALKTSYDAASVKLQNLEGQNRIKA